MNAFKSNSEEMIKDLKNSLNISNVSWSDWEESFISEIYEKVYDRHLKLSAAQVDKVIELWERL